MNAITRGSLIHHFVKFIDFSTVYSNLEFSGSSKGVKFLLKTHILLLLVLRLISVERIKISTHTNKKHSLIQNAHHCNYIFRTPFMEHILNGYHLTIFLIWNHFYIYAGKSKIPYDKRIN